MDHIAHIRGKRRGITAHLLTLGGTVGLCLLIFPACSPKIVEKVRTEYVYRDVHHRDTTVRHDSVYIREFVKGDTVHHYEYRDRYVYRDRWRDSESVREVHDTTVVERKVEKPLSAMQKAKIGAFPWLLGAIAILFLWVFRRPILAILKKWLPIG